MRELITSPDQLQAGDQIEGIDRVTEEVYRATVLWRGQCECCVDGSSPSWHLAERALRRDGKYVASVADESIREGRVWRRRRPPEGLKLVRRRELVRP